MWLQTMATGDAVQTMPASVEGYGNFQFSPDGQQIYYNTKGRSSPNLSIARVALFGGTPQEIVTDVWGNFALSPDGKQVAFVRGPSLVIAGTEGKVERDLIKLTVDIGGFVTWGSQLSWSPDGGRIAICAVRTKAGRDHAELLEISVSDGAPRILSTPDWNAIDDAVWLADGASLLVTAREKEGESFQIWRLAYPSGQTTRVTNDSNNYDWLSLTADSRTLVAEQRFSRQNIWVASLADMSNAKQLTTSSVAADGFSGIAFAPDDTIIFTSPRSGNIDLWRMNADGSNQQQLTANAGNINRRPNVTPDGRYIVFVSSRTGTKQIWRMDANGQNAMRLTDSTNPEDFPHLSSDGKWIYYSSSSEERQTIMKVSIHGGSSVRVSDSVAANVSIIGDSVPSPDGRLLACGAYVDK
jgi:Tol biopolymer transport system component